MKYGCILRSNNKTKKKETIGGYNVLKSSFYTISYSFTDYSPCPVYIRDLWVPRFLVNYMLCKLNRTKNKTNIFTVIHVNEQCADLATSTEQN